MRITGEEKQATRERILTSAVELFRTSGFDATTTRDLARAAGIAAGTLFNYFPSKEAILGELAAAALVKAREIYATGAPAADFSEELFALVACELRQLRSLRKFIAPLFDITLCPLSAARPAGQADETLRVAHLELVVELAARHGLVEVPPLALQVYWTLYTGVLAFWAADKSPQQEDTLALLDQSLQMFAAWLASAAKVAS